MSKIITFGTQKGGNGKSTVTNLTANTFSQTFKLKVLVLDCDKQKSLYKTRQTDIKRYELYSVPEPYKIISLNLNELPNRIKDFDKDFDIVLIDYAGELDAQNVGKILSLCDYVFVIFCAGSFNFTSSLDYLNFAKNIQTVRSATPRPLKNISPFINFHRPRTTAQKNLMSDIRAVKVETMLNYLNDYALFKETDTYTDLYDTQSADAAKHNFTLFCNEVINAIR